MIVDVREADNGTWSIQCNTHGMIDSGHTYTDAAAIALDHHFSEHDGE